MTSIPLGSPLPQTDAGIVQKTNAQSKRHRIPQKGLHMLGWALTFLIIAIIAAILGFGGIAGAATSIAKILFFVFIVLFIISLIARALRGGAPPA